MFLSEKEVEDELCRLLAQEGITYRRQLYLGSAGIADVVTEDIIYEVKKKLSRSIVKKAIGQLQLYSTSLPGKKLVIAGQFGDGVNLRKVAQKAGIEMLVLEHPGIQHKRILDEKEAKYQLEIDKREKVKTSVGMVLVALLPVAIGLMLIYPQAIFLLIILMIVTVAYSKQ